MIENFVERIPESLKSKPGAPFYSGRSAFSEPSDLYILGIHPGGEGGQSVSEHIDWVMQRNRPTGRIIETGTGAAQNRVNAPCKGICCICSNRWAKSRIRFPQARQ